MKFFLENEKITIIAIVVIALFGSLAYVMLPKQYNPSIVAPAFMIQIPANGYTSYDASQFIARGIEDKIKELEWIDKIQSYAMDNFASIVTTFKVGTPQETAKTRLYDKIFWSVDVRPFGIDQVLIKSIDPEELPQVTFAISYSGAPLPSVDEGIYLRNIAVRIKEWLKLVPQTTTIDIVGGYSNDISIELDKTKIEWYRLDVAQVVQVIKSSPIFKTLGFAEKNATKTMIFIDGGLDNEKALKEFVVGNVLGQKIQLRDIARVYSGPIDIKSMYRFSDSKESHDSVFLWVAKVKGSNGVVVVKNVLTKMEEIKKDLPKNVRIEKIQDEWMTAEHATSELTFHLFFSIAIVFVILVIFLGIRNAINAAFCIPMVLWLVFITALITGLDINRITLFALILALWILVDDSIVVVENNARHLGMISQTGKTKAQAVLDSIREVWPSVIFSTLTRILSFMAMFAVNGMMGDYIKPIPIFSTIALSASVFVALSINPFLAVRLHKDGAHDTHKEWDGKFFTWYGKLLGKYVSTTKQSLKKRKWLRIGFVVGLIIVMLIPAFPSIFKLRLLPKSNKDQVYIWVDAPRSVTTDTSSIMEKKISDFVLGKTIKLPKELQIVENVSSSVGDRFMPDFANLFRGGNMRIGSNQVSLRINLLPKEDRSTSSEEFVMQMRPLLRDYFMKAYPDAKLRLLEDPPGPPTVATFHAKIKWQEDISFEDLSIFADSVQSLVDRVASKQHMVDIINSSSSAMKKVRIRLDNDRIREKWLSIDQISGTIAALYNPMQIAFVHTNERQMDIQNIILGFKKDKIWDINYWKTIYFTLPTGDRVYLDEIATVQEEFANPEIYSENRSMAINIYSELGNNSVLYPTIELYDLLDSPEFTKTGYKVTNKSFYGIDFVGVKDGKKYRIEWGGEWEMTMDVFRDLGIALSLSLLAIYFLVVAQFRSFRVWGIILSTFLFSFFWVMPGFAILFLIKSEYLTATSMIWLISLGGIVIGNAIILVDYINQLLEEGKSPQEAIIEWSKKRLMPVLLTSMAAIFGSFIIVTDPVWSGLSWAIIWWLTAAAGLTLFLIPVFYYDFLIKRKK